VLVQDVCIWKTSGVGRQIPTVVDQYGRAARDHIVRVGWLRRARSVHGSDHARDLRRCAAGMFVSSKADDGDRYGDRNIRAHVGYAAEVAIWSSVRRPVD
jgi:hypothetical protein